MKNNIKQLDPTQIISPVFIIAPTQIDHISKIFGDAVADAMNMRTFAPKIRQIARTALEKALIDAKTRGNKE
jgi:hypothetical protein